MGSNSRKKKLNVQKYIVIMEAKSFHLLFKRYLAMSINIINNYEYCTKPAIFLKW